MPQYSWGNISSMLKDVSYGIVPVKRSGDGWQFLLIQHNAGHWSFPKGHPEEGETSKQSAEREFSEETGLKVLKYLSDKIFEEHYFFIHEGMRIDKTVGYFVAEVEGVIHLQEEEVQDCRWAEFEDAMELMTFDEGKKLLQSVWVGLEEK